MVKRCPYCEADLQKPIPSPKDVELAKTPKGGWTRDTLRDWGVPWPPPKGWRDRLRDIWKRAMQ